MARRRIKDFGSTLTSIRSYTNLELIWLVLIGATGKEDAMRDRDHDEAMAELFRNDPSFAIELINDILEDGQQDVLLETLRQIAMGFGGVQSVAESAQLSPTQLYRTLSAEGNPVLSSFTAILKAMGLRLAVQPINRD